MIIISQHNFIRFRSWFSIEILKNTGNQSGADSAINYIPSLELHIHDPAGDSVTLHDDSLPILDLHISSPLTHNFPSELGASPDVSAFSEYVTAEHIQPFLILRRTALHSAMHGSNPWYQMCDQYSICILLDNESALIMHQLSYHNLAFTCNNGTYSIFPFFSPHEKAVHSRSCHMGCLHMSTVF